MTEINISVDDGAVRYTFSLDSNDHDRALREALKFLASKYDEGEPKPPTINLHRDGQRNLARQAQQREDDIARRGWQEAARAAQRSANRPPLVDYDEDDDGLGGVRELV